MSDATQHEACEESELVIEQRCEEMDRLIEKEALYEIVHHPRGVLQRAGRWRRMMARNPLGRIHRRNATMIRNGVALEKRLAKLQYLFDMLKGPFYVDLRADHEK